MLGPFHFDGDELAAAGNDEIHLRARLGAQVMQFAAAQVLQAFSQLDAHPLLEHGAGIRPDCGCFQRQFGSKTAPWSRLLRGLPENAVTRNPRNMSSGN